MMHSEFTAVGTQKATGADLKANILAANGGASAADALATPPYPIISAAEVLKGSPNPPLVKGVLRARSVAMLFGDTGTYKSFLGLDLALHVAAGFPMWLGHKVKIQGPVVYIAAEGGGSVRNRLAAWLKYHHMTEAQIADAGFLLKTVPVLDDVAISALLKEIDALPVPPCLVVLDTLSAAIAGADENGSATMSQAAANARRIAEHTGAAVVIVHHVGKGLNAKAFARGHTALHCAADVVILQQKPVAGKGMLTSKKQRDDPDFLPICFSLESVPLGLDEDGDPVTSLVVVPIDGPSAPSVTPLLLNDTLKLALKVLSELPETTATTSAWTEAMSDAMGKVVSKKTFDNQRKTLLADGLIEQVKIGVYVLTGNGLLEILKTETASAI
jgi:hypothetical protein